MKALDEFVFSCVIKSFAMRYRNLIAGFKLQMQLFGLNIDLVLQS